ncbi:MAG TPA: DUF721 domain-containing protein [Bacteroidia bacterium]
MRKSNQQSIGEVLAEFLKQNRLDKRLHHADIIGKWEEIVGSLFAKHTKNIYFMGTKLILEIDSSSLRNELLMQRNAIIEKINKLAGEQLVTEIVLK